jgi:hypothetical protein
MKLATVDLTLGLAVVPKGDPALNEVRKRMMSWIWVSTVISSTISLTLKSNLIYLSQDTVRDVILNFKVDEKFPRYATYDRLTKTQGDNLVASVCTSLGS